MFVQNKYSRWYNDIISNAQRRVNTSIIEKHHIIPKSMGGTNDKTNIVKLTPREHFICHLLLTKMTVGNAKYKMTTALCLMIKNTSSKLNRTHITSKNYDMCVLFSRVKFSDEHRAKLSQRAKNRPRQIVSDITKAKTRASMMGKNKGKISSLETRAKISIAKKGISIGPSSFETKAKISKANTGKTHSQATKDKLAKTWRLQQPNLSLIEIHSLKGFCETNYLNYTSLMNTKITKKPISRGRSAGWMIVC